MTYWVSDPDGARGHIEIKLDSPKFPLLQSLSTQGMMQW